MIERLFLDHPRRVGESYFEHAATAVGFGLALITAGLACLVHALVPALFIRTASDAIRRLHARLGPRRATPVHAPTARDWQLTCEI